MRPGFDLDGGQVASTGGAFFMCTETWPRCFVIKQVSDVDGALKEVKQQQQQEQSCSSSSVPLANGEHSTTSSGHKLMPAGMEGEAAASSAATSPYLPMLPWWFTAECRQQLLAVPGPEDWHHRALTPETRPPSSIGATSGTINSHEQLRARLTRQLEYYFSRENLINDRYLRCQMDADQYVPIKIVANFPKVAQLSTDFELIVDVLKSSSQVQVDETGTRVRPMSKRCTIILREVPQNADENEVKAMFQGDGCPPYLSLAYGLNDSWYVTFGTEEDTQQAFFHLQTLGKTFNGKPVFARIKTGAAPICADLHTRHGPDGHILLNGGHLRGQLIIHDPAFPSTASDHLRMTPSPQLNGGDVNSGGGGQNGLAERKGGGGTGTGTEVFNLGKLLAQFGYVPRATFRPHIPAPTAPVMPPLQPTTTSTNNGGTLVNGMPQPTSYFTQPILHNGFDHMIQRFPPPHLPAGIPFDNNYHFHQRWRHPLSITAPGDQYDDPNYSYYNNVNGGYAGNGGYAENNEDEETEEEEGEEEDNRTECTEIVENGTDENSTKMVENGGQTMEENNNENGEEEYNNNNSDNNYNNNYNTDNYNNDNYNYSNDNNNDYDYSASANANGHFQYCSNCCDDSCGSNCAEEHCDGGRDDIVNDGVINNNNNHYDHVQHDDNDHDDDDDDGVVEQNENNNDNADDVAVGQNEQILRQRAKERGGAVSPVLIPKEIPRITDVPKMNGRGAFKAVPSSNQQSGDAAKARGGRHSPPLTSGAGFAGFQRQESVEAYQIALAANGVSKQPKRQQSMKEEREKGDKSGAEIGGGIPTTGGRLNKAVGSGRNSLPKSASTGSRTNSMDQAPPRILGSHGPRRSEPPTQHPNRVTLNEASASANWRQHAQQPKQQLQQRQQSQPSNVPATPTANVNISTGGGGGTIATTTTSMTNPFFSMPSTDFRSHQHQWQNGTAHPMGPPPPPPHNPGNIQSLLSLGQITLTNQMPPHQYHQHQQQHQQHQHHPQHPQHQQQQQYSSNISNNVGGGGGGINHHHNQAPSMAGQSRGYDSRKPSGNRDPQSLRGGTAAGGAPSAYRQRTWTSDYPSRGSNSGPQGHQMAGEQPHFMAQRESRGSGGGGGGGHWNGPRGGGGIGRGGGGMNRGGGGVGGGKRSIESGGGGNDSGMQMMEGGGGAMEGGGTRKGPQEGGGVLHRENRHFGQHNQQQQQRPPPPHFAHPPPQHHFRHEQRQRSNTTATGSSAPSQERSRTEQQHGGGSERRNTQGASGGGGGQKLLKATGEMPATGYNFEEHVEEFPALSLSQSNSRKASECHGEQHQPLVVLAVPELAEEKCPEISSANEGGGEEGIVDDEPSPRMMPFSAVVASGRPRRATISAGATAAKMPNLKEANGRKLTDAVNEQPMIGPEKQQRSGTICAGTMAQHQQRLMVVVGGGQRSYAQMLKSGAPKSSNSSTKENNSCGSSASVTGTEV